jgi:hypothetical protein
VQAVLPYTAIISCNITQSREPARSKASACDLSLQGIAGSNPAGAMDVYLLCVLYCQVGFLARVISLIQKSPTECAVSECVRGTSHR